MRPFTTLLILFLSFYTHGLGYNFIPAANGEALYFTKKVKKNTSLTSYKNTATQNLRNDSILLTKSKVLHFINQLEKRENLSSFFSKNWTLIYYTDNRCDGITNGQAHHLKSKQIDSTISFSVTNDGDGWACEKKEPSSYNFDFNLQKKIAHWDRFEVLPNEDPESTIWYVLGAGESDYLKVYYNNKNLISTLEYRSEDPG